MKLDFNKKYLKLVICACIVTAFTVICVFVGINFNVVIGGIKNFFDLLNPFIIGAIIAYLLNPILKFCENNVFKFVERKKKRFKLKRVLSLILTYIILAFLITVFVWIIIPQVTVSYKNLEQNMKTYIKTAQEWIASLEASSENVHVVIEWLTDRIDFSKIAEQFKDIISNAFTVVSSAAPQVAGWIKDFVGQIFDVVVGIIISIYLLLSKEKLLAQLKKLMYSLMSEEKIQNILEFFRFTDHTFGGYIVGVIIDSTMVGLVCYIAMTIIGIPYAALISVIIGVTNIIPFFGPFIGAVPSAVILFLASPKWCLWFVIMILVLQQIDGNIIAPRIIGETTGLSSLGVILSITLMGGLFGIVGMTLAVPAFALIYDTVKKTSERRLAAKDLPIETENYYDK